MPKKLLKSHRYAMRLEPGMFHRMQTIAVALGAPLPEIICVAVLRLLATTTTAEQYSAVKVQRSWVTRRARLARPRALRRNIRSVGITTWLGCVDQAENSLAG